MKNNSIQKYDESEELYYAELAKMGFKVVREKRPKPEISSVAVDNHLKPFSNIIPLGEKRKAGCNILQTDTIKSVFKSSKISKKEDSLPKFHPLSSAMGERNHSNKKDGITISTIANKNYAKADSDNANFGEEEEVANLAGEVRNEDDDEEDDDDDDDGMGNNKQRRCTLHLLRSVGARKSSAQFNDLFYSIFLLHLYFSLKFRPVLLLLLLPFFLPQQYIINVCK